ncbi:acyl carrier protein [Paremcibacter congregatus]|uniref:Phosphopantetheine-binding protein n=1 Tax=Paremcibacter congregatus TaxID=2043170 RepID=A0A2G4YNE4_9PROT|nr:phosphopantetheine-binding protein [Paremcibacter congregatus]PHZ83827.1 phosphopantetheine-binding protein [Paremcibacter congregatus]QDE27531.1 acyl carrier protein [Paremcibacter congregatus]|tara:strand:- start:272 stop:520 length:249 start_codon:yes stop_codon:yes gene_type:complete
MTQNNDEIFEQICALIKPFNKKNVTLTKDTVFSVDLELDSLTVMDLLSEIEDEFDITVPLNMLPDLETVGQFTDAVEKLVSE